MTVEFADPPDLSPDVFLRGGAGFDFLVLSPETALRIPTFLVFFSLTYNNG